MKQRSSSPNCEIKSRIANSELQRGLVSRFVRVACAQNPQAGVLWLNGDNRDGSAVGRCLNTSQGSTFPPTSQLAVFS